MVARTSFKRGEIVGSTFHNNRFSGTQIKGAARRGQLPVQPLAHSNPPKTQRSPPHRLALCFPLNLLPLLSPPRTCFQNAKVEGRDESRPYISDGGHLLSLLPTAGEKCGLTEAVPAPPPRFPPSFLPPFQGSTLFNS